MSGERSTRRWVVLSGLAGVVLAGALTPSSPSTLARYTDATAPSGAIVTDTLAPPTALTAIGGANVVLGWTPTVDGYAAGYQLLRSATSGSGHVVVATISPRTTTVATDAPGTGTWYYLLRSVYQS